MVEAIQEYKIKLIKLKSWNTTAQKRHRKAKHHQHTGKEQKSILYKSKAQGN